MEVTELLGPRASVHDSGPARKRLDPPCLRDANLVTRTTRDALRQLGGRIRRTVLALAHSWMAGRWTQSASDRSRAGAPAPGPTPRPAKTSDDARDGAVAECGAGTTSIGRTHVRRIGLGPPVRHWRHCEHNPQVDGWPLGDEPTFTDSSRRAPLVRARPSQALPFDP